MKYENSNATSAASGSSSEAFGRFYEQYLPRVFQYVNYRVGDKTTAEDLTSDIFNKALTNFAKYDSGKAAFSTWLFSIARNTVIDYYRKRGLERKLQEKETDSMDVVSSRSTDEEVARLEEIRKLQVSISLLNANEQELISLKFSGGMTNREIGRITGLSESNVGTILCRAIRKLRDSFLGWHHEG